MSNTATKTGQFYFPRLDEAVAVYLRREGMKQDELAGVMGMAPNTFSWKRRGVREFTMGEITQLCDLLDIGIDYAIGRDDYVSYTLSDERRPARA